MKKVILLPTILLFLVACNKLSDFELAQQRVDKAAELVQNNQLNAAKIELDSVHILYPREVAVRRIAKALNDSIIYIEAQRSLHYSDSLLNELSPKVDSVQNLFKYNKNEQYQDQGEYVHRLLQTTGNTSRCYLQVYVLEDGQAMMKSYYYGTNAIDHHSVSLSAGENIVSFNGDTHHFNDGLGEHEILTLSNDDALMALNFVSSNMEERIKITLSGDREYIYYLNTNEKTALEDSYRLATLMTDENKLRQNVHFSQLQIAKYENMSKNIEK